MIPATRNAVLQPAIDRTSTCVTSRRSTVTTWGSPSGRSTRIPVTFVPSTFFTSRTTGSPPSRGCTRMRVDASTAVPASTSWSGTTSHLWQAVPKATRVTTATVRNHAGRPERDA